MKCIIYKDQHTDHPQPCLTHINTAAQGVDQLWNLYK
jgi:hypothetical protein